MSDNRTAEDVIKEIEAEGYIIDRLGNITSSNEKHFAKRAPQKNNPSWYRGVWLTVNGTGKWYMIHRLVAMKYIPNPENKPQVNHKNGIKTDNRVENLEWCTLAENNRHAFRTGLNKGPWFGKSGKDHNCSKAVIQQKVTGEIVAEYGSVMEAARHVGRSAGNLVDALTGKNKTSAGHVWKYKALSSKESKPS